MQNTVETAERYTQTQVIEKYVEDWLTDATNVLKNVETLERRVEENKKCLRCFPNLWWQYRLCKAIEDEVLSSKRHINWSKFEKMGHRVQTPIIEFLASKHIVPSKSVCCF